MNKVYSWFRNFFRSLSELPENVPSKNYRYYVVGGYTFFAALLFHFFFIFIFFLFSVKSLALFNIGSTLIWILILRSHLKGRVLVSALLGSIEVNLHAVMCVIIIGWDIGFQYYILSLPLLMIFAPFLHYSLKFVSISLCCFIYAGLYLLFANSLPLHELEPWIKNILTYGNILMIFFILSLASYYYHTAAINSEAALEQEKSKSEEMATLLKKMFGRYLSTEVMNSLIEDPSNLELGGEKRSVTIMMTDLRGFTGISERLKPEQVVQMLNAYFEIMMEVILKYNGTINEIVGDALLVVFGAPQEMPERRQQAIACAIEMQNTMSVVNRQNLSRGLPELEMGIGLNETEVIVGNIGSSKRSKYAVVGSGVNMTSRIESYTVGGQILISESVFQEVGDILRIDAQLDIASKGLETTLRLYEVGGIAGSYNLALGREDPARYTLTRQIPLHYNLLESKDIVAKRHKGFINRLSKNSAEIIIGEPIRILDNLKMNLGDVDEKLATKDFYGKVIREREDDKQTYVVRFTSLPPEIDAYLQALRRHAVKQD